MKKTVIASLVVCAGLFTTSCKPKESAYRRAYEQAKQREIAAQSNETYTNNVSTPSQESTSLNNAKNTNIAVRRERVSTLPGENSDDLKQYSVVIGSFTNPTNAYNLKDKMVAQGYKAILAKNNKDMLRVIIASFPTKEEAAASRDAFKARFAPNYSDAWLLERDN